MSRVGYAEDIEDRRGEPPVNPQNTPITQQVAGLETALARVRRERDDLLPGFKAAMERLQKDMHNLVHDPKHLEVLERRIIARLDQVVSEQIGEIQGQLKGIESVLGRINTMLTRDQKRKDELNARLSRS